MTIVVVALLSVLGQRLDDALSLVAPQWALRRAAARAAYSQFRSYEAGRLDRTTARWGSQSEAGDSPNLAEIQRSRYRAWDLYRNNRHAKKVVRALLSQVIGRGMWPEPEIEAEATDAAVRKLWKAWAKFPMAIGRPGNGGLGWVGLSKLILREVVISGECLVRLRALSSREMRRDGRSAPLAIEVIEADRLVEDATTLQIRPSGDNAIFRGIEIDSLGRRVAYHVYDAHPQHPAHWHARETVRIPADEILHVFLPDRASQYRGVSWFAPLLLQLRDVDDYQYNELMASTVGACVALAIKVNPGAGSLGLQTPSGQDSTDNDDNSKTRFQPGQIMRLQPGEDVTMLNPMRPGANVTEFANHMLRGVAAALPGIKSSTVIGDYRESSFASERSADNDNWRETEDAQEWLVSCLCQPIYERLLLMSAMAGMIPGVTPTNIDAMSIAIWSAPVPKSINPDVDAKASLARIKAGTSSVQNEAGSLGQNWQQLMGQAKAVIDEGERLGLPPQFVLGMLGVEQVPQPAGENGDSPPGQSSGGSDDESDNRREEGGE